jgi:RNA polymerase primary sigma factor
MAAASGLGWWLDQIGRIPLLTPAEEIELGNQIQAWLHHPDGPDACPPGIKRRGRRAKERFVRANLRLAVSYISKHCHRLAKKTTTEDLIQAANEGLIRAVERFDPHRGYRFSTYAYWWIRQAVNRHIDQHGRLVAIPGSHSQHLGRLGPITRRLERELNRTPTREELAAELGVSMAVFEQLLINARPISSLDVQLDDDGPDLGDVVATYDQTLEEQEEQQDRWRQIEQLRGLIRKLPRTDRDLLSMAWGLDGEEVKPKELAARYGLSVRQLEQRLEGLQQQLRHQAVQLVLIAIPRQPVVAVSKVVKRRRVKVAPGQLSLLTLAPSGSAQLTAQAIPA